MDTNDLRLIFLHTPCILLSYTEAWDASSVGVVVLQRIKDELSQAVLVTWNSSFANRTLKRSNYLKDNILIRDYSCGDELLTYSASNSVKNDKTIVFDSIQEILNTDNFKAATDDGYVLAGMDLIIRLIENGNRIVILFTRGITRDILIKLHSTIPGALLCYATFLNRSNHLDFVLHECYKTNKQEIAYSNIRNKELTSEDIDPNFYEESQKICNILLPDSITSLLGTDNEPTIDDMLDSYTEIIQKFHNSLSKNSSNPINSKSKNIDYDEKIEKVEETKFNYTNFLQDAPKLKELLIQLHLYRDMKHVIYTRYNDHHGAKMIAGMLKLKGFKIFCVSRDIDTSKQLEILKEYNASDYGILVMSTYVIGMEGIMNVNHLHFIDSDYTKIDILLEQIFKFRLYKKVPCSLLIHNYVCKKSKGEPSADEILYSSFGKYITEITKIWKEIQSTARPVVIGKNNGHLSIIGTVPVSL